MKILILVFLSLSVYSCAPRQKAPAQTLPANSETILYSTYGEAPVRIAVEGYGYITKSGVVLHKNMAVNYAIANCPVRYRGGWFGIKGCIRPNMACTSESTSHYRLFIHPIEKGKTLKDSIRRRKVGYSVSNSIEAVRFDMNNVGTAQRCFFIATSNGHPVPVRPGTDIESYLFTNPLILRAMKQRELDSEVFAAESYLKTTEMNILSSERYLKKSPNFQKGQCVALKQRPIPPKPKVMPYADAYDHADMACIDMLASRHEARAVYEALGAVGRRDLMKKHIAWASGETSLPSCARVNYSQVGNFVCDALGFLSPHAFRSCVQDAFQSCKSSVINQCQSALFAWKMKVNSIIEEPERNKNACQRQKRSLAHETTRLLTLNKNLEEARLTAQTTFPKPALQKLDLEDARCES